MTESQLSSGRKPRTTIIVVPRERFGVALESLDSIYANTDAPFDLVYVNGNAPRALTGRLREEAAEKGFTHLEIDRFLSPNEARNIGLRRAGTDYVVFMDNDVVCSPGWLEALVRCADETGADVVAPLTCEGSPAHTIVHQAGADFAPDPAAFFRQPHGQRQIVEVMYHQYAKAADLKDSLKRQETQCCEFHCALVRRSVFDRIGLLDEGMLATKDHLDFCMSVMQAGGKVMLEPGSVVTFPTMARPLQMSDWPYFLVRWSEVWQRRSMDRLREKWGLASEGYLQERSRMYSWRHREGLIKPLARRAPWVGERPLWQKASGRALMPIVRLASNALVAHTERRRRAAV